MGRGNPKIARQGNPSHCLGSCTAWMKSFLPSRNNKKETRRKKQQNRLKNCESSEISGNQSKEIRAFQEYCLGNIERKTINCELSKRVPWQMGFKCITTMEIVKKETWGQRWRRTGMLGNYKIRHLIIFNYKIFKFQVTYYVIIKNLQVIFLIIKDL